MSYLSVIERQQFVLDSQKWIGELIIDLGDRPNVEFYVPDQIISQEGWPAKLYIRYRSNPYKLSVALTLDSDHLCRYDSDEHDGMRPHLHFCDGTREMHENVYQVPEDWPDQTNIAALFRRILDHWRIGFSTLEIHERGMRLF